MPIYEYRCDECAKVSSIFFRQPKTAAAPVCQHCGSARLNRVISSVGRLKSQSDVREQYGSPRPGERYSDPRQIGRWVESQFEAYGVDLPEESRRMIDAAREGELPGPASEV